MRFQKLQFRYKNQAKGEFASSIKSEEKLEKSQRKDDEDNEYSNELQSVQELRTISGESVCFDFL